MAATHLAASGDAVLDGPRRLDEVSLPDEVKARLRAETAAHIEERALRSGAMHPLTALAMLPSSVSDLFPRTFFTFFAVMAALFVARSLTLVLLMRRPPSSFDRRRTLFLIPWLGTALVYGCFCTWVVVAMPGSWESVAMCAASGLAGLAAVIYFSAYGWATLAYALLMSTPPGLTAFFVTGGEGPGLVMLFMWLVFVLLVIPSLKKLHDDYWTGLVGRAVLEERAALATSESEKKSVHLANVTHDLRTPLSGIIGMSRMLLETPLDDRGRDAALALHRASLSMLDLVNDLLDAEQALAGRFRLEDRAFDVVPLIHEVVALFEAEARSRETTIEVALDGSIPNDLVGDTRRIRQILQNLVSNAVRVTQRGSIVVTGRVEPSGDDDRVVLVIAVVDSGVGFKSEDSERLFERFSSVARRHAGSSGLGLSVSRDIAALMGGSLVAESPGVGRGARFTLAVPLRRASVDETIGFGRVLLADDDELSLRVTEAMLLRLGCVVGTARSGSEALALARTDAFDAYVLDCMMPGLSGAEVAAALRASTDAPIVAVTANAEQNSEACTSAGVDVVLSKPLELDTLRDALVTSARRRHRRVA